MSDYKAVFPKRLRALHEISPPATSILLEAADEIERLTAALQTIVEDDDGYYRTAAFIAQAALQESE